MRSVEELTRDTTGWNVVKDAIKLSRNKYQILPADLTKAKQAIYNTQVTTRSPMGAIIFLTGGILIEDGWIRILGSGNTSLLDRSLPGWNKGKSFNKYGERPEFMLVADDIIGGFFAINGGSIGSEIGKVYYLAPNDLKWEPLHLSYSDFINFCFIGDLKLFYEDLGWPECRRDVTTIDGNKSFYFYPFLWTAEGKNMSKDQRSIVPVNEIYKLKTDAMKALNR